VQWKTSTGPHRDNPHDHAVMLLSMAATTHCRLQVWTLHSCCTDRHCLEHPASSVSVQNTWILHTACSSGMACHSMHQTIQGAGCFLCGGWYHHDPGCGGASVRPKPCNHMRWPLGAAAGPGCTTEQHEASSLPGCVPVPLPKLGLRLAQPASFNDTASQQHPTESRAAYNHCIGLDAPAGHQAILDVRVRCNKCLNLLLQQTAQDRNGLRAMALHASRQDAGTKLAESLQRGKLWLPCNARPRGRTGTGIDGDCAGDLDRPSDTRKKGANIGNPHEPRRLAG